MQMQSKPALFEAFDAALNVQDLGLLVENFYCRVIYREPLTFIRYHFSLQTYGMVEILALLDPSA